MGNQGEPPPYDVMDAAGFVEAMQRLKERSGLTYRELEEKAARSGDVLARSTLADVLRRSSLPRPEVVAAFVRACGEERYVDDWLAVRERVAAVQVTSPDRPDDGCETGDDGRAPEATGASRARPTWFRPSVLAGAFLIPLLAVVAWGLLPDSSEGGSGTSGTPTTPTAAGTASRAPADGWVTIRPARTPELCLTDGRDRAGAYDSAVAVQLPCAQATVPRTYLEPAGENLYRIQWHHPQLGKGCLTVMSSGPVKDMLEPRDDCAHATLFRLLPVGARNAEKYSLRPVNGRCVGIAGEDTAVGAEAVEERCTGGVDQRFVVKAD
ncbi:XRE family transcriptional regulator [Streptomyces sp. NPDC002888]|uniref:XRE family transcriptional regulator n=1 Tax=Streptomyces sp. NPDC002888 TaxID=3364668 RepID=UPI003688CA77